LPKNWILKYFLVKSIIGIWILLKAIFHISNPLLIAFLKLAFVLL